MTAQEPVSEPMEFSLTWDDPEPFRAEDVIPTPWDQARTGLEQADTYWLATARPDGRPHAVPVLAVMVDGALHFCANDRSQKARNLRANPRCVLMATSDTLDLVVEGEAAAVSDDATVRRAADAYAAKYGWHPEVRDGALWADGAPTAGPPPYRVHQVRPATTFGFPTDDTTIPTRWRF